MIRLLLDPKNEDAGNEVVLSGKDDTPGGEKDQVDLQKEEEKPNAGDNAEQVADDPEEAEDKDKEFAEAGMTSEDQAWVDFGKNRATGYTPDQVFEAAQRGLQLVVEPSAEKELADGDDDDMPMTRAEFKTAMAKQARETERTVSMGSIIQRDKNLTQDDQFAIEAVAERLRDVHPKANAAQLYDTAYDMIRGPVNQARKRNAVEGKRKTADAQMRAKSNRSVPAGRGASMASITEGGSDVSGVDDNPNAILDGSAMDAFLKGV